MQATIQENGEVGDHSADPAFYSRPIPTAGMIRMVLRGHPPLRVKQVCSHFLRVTSIELVSVQLSVVDLEDTAYGQVITGEHGIHIACRRR
jgi:hypothetical protein